MALINDIAQHLHNNVIGVLGTSLFWSYLPESPDAAYAVLDTGGIQPDRYLSHKSPTFQIMIRQTTYALGKAKLDTIRSLLHGVKESNIGDTYFVYLYAISEGGHLGRDDNGRDLFSINFQCLIR